MTTRSLLAALLLALGLLTPVTAHEANARDEAPTPPPDPPNLVVLMLDDATVDDVDQMPNVQRLLADQGVTFTHFYSSFPQCCPARATVLTGRYAHNHRVLDINPPLGGFQAFDDTHTIATYLDPSHRTGIFGKYLNGYAEDSPVSPGWDVFRVPVQGVYDYLLQTVKREDGTTERVEGYLPSLHAEQARDFIDQTPPDQPYFAYLGWVAPHNGLPREGEGDPPSPYVPAQLRGTYHGEPVPADASFNERRVDDKRRAVRGLRPLGPRAVAAIEETRAQRRETLSVVDAEVERIVDLVASRGELDETYFLFTSDNGFMEGQHRIRNGKLQAYEPSTAVPMIVRGPGFAPGTTYSSVTGLQDVAPTLLDLAGATMPAEAPAMDGVSLAALVDGRVRTRRPEVIEIANNSRPSARAVPGSAWRARGVVSHNGRWKYVEYPVTGEAEMYDLRRDPHELRSLAKDPDYKDRKADMAQLLRAYRTCAGEACWR